MYFHDKVAPESNLIPGYIRFIIRCEQRGVPPIFEERHLSLLIGIPYPKLNFFLSSAPGRYRTFTIPKRRGGHREINVPSPLLLLVQKWVLKKILYQLPVSECAHGGVLGRSILSNARVHLGAKAILRVDLKDFFDTIHLPLGIRIFESVGYSPKVSRSLALLCFESGRLPQGAATSMTLANLAAISLDSRLEALATNFGLFYTRYVDDLTFSGDSIGQRFFHSVNDIIDQCGFTVNSDKTQLVRGNSPKFVTGISVAGDRLRVPRSFRREVRNSAFQLQRRGIFQHIEATKSSDPFILEKTLGRLAFWLQVEPDCEMARKLFSELSMKRRTIVSNASLPAPRRSNLRATVPPAD